MRSRTPVQDKRIRGIIVAPYEAKIIDLEMQVDRLRELVVQLTSGGSLALVQGNFFGNSFMVEFDPTAFPISASQTPDKPSSDDTQAL